jgi:hypothetical protein
MAVIPPVVRHMLVCDDVTTNPLNASKVNLIGLTTYVQARGAFPVLTPQLCVYLQFTNGRGVGRVQVRVREAATNRLLVGSRLHWVAFPNSPLPVHGMVFRVRNCVFLQPGLCHVEFCVDGKTVAVEPLMVR